MKLTSHSYYVVMIDYGKPGLAADVRPELTRRAVVEMLASGESKHVVFIHHVDGLFIEDVTEELFNEAELLARMAAPMISLADRIQSDFDHARDLRKHEVV